MALGNVLQLAESEAKGDPGKAFGLERRELMSPGHESKPSNYLKRVRRLFPHCFQHRVLNTSFLVVAVSGRTGCSEVIPDRRDDKMCLLTGSKEIRLHNFHKVSSTGP